MNVLLIVDTKNIFNTLHCQYGNGKLDFKSFIEHAAGPDHIYTAIAYGCHGGVKTYGFETLLQKLGFMCKFTHFDPTYANSPNVQIAIDVIKLVTSGKIDRVIIASADSDLVDLIYWVREQGLVCEIHACRVSRMLRDAATSVKDIDRSLLLST